MEITRERLASYFHLPSELACRELGIGLTVLKRQCRKYGILRWPFRKMKSLDNLIQRITDNERNNNTLSVSGGALKSVEELEEQKRKLEECAIVDLDGETKRMQQAFSKATHKQRLKQNLSLLRPRTTRVEGGGSKRKPVWDTPEEDYGAEEEEEERFVDAGGVDGKRARKPNSRYADSCPTQPRPLVACASDLLASLVEAALEKEEFEDLPHSGIPDDTLCIACQDHMEYLRFVRVDILTVARWNQLDDSDEFKKFVTECDEALLAVDSTISSAKNLHDIIQLLPVHTLSIVAGLLRQCMSHERPPTAFERMIKDIEILIAALCEPTVLGPADHAVFLRLESCTEKLPKFQVCSINSRNFEYVNLRGVFQGEEDATTIRINDNGTSLYAGTVWDVVKVKVVQGTGKSRISNTYVI